MRLGVSIFALAALPFAGIGCRSASRAEPVYLHPSLLGADEADVESLPEPAILAAHFGQIDAASLGGLDSVSVVFSAEVDPVSVDPRAFLVFFADGSRATPSAAVLSPANEADEHHTVSLLGEFGEVPSAERPGNPPTEVFVVDAVFSEAGRTLQGLSSLVEPFDKGGRVALAEWMPPGPGRCEGADRVIRTYWWDDLRGVDPAALGSIDIVMAGGTTVHPFGFDDHALGSDERDDDNVLDLCVSGSGEPERLRVAAVSFRDPAGHPSAAVDVPIVSPTENTASSGGLRSSTKLP